ncbi:hypothetical protein PMAYCL1PPCAC_32231 [Pristionchus mayeri]|uniref:Uncharacterized protein n=1 Tax=Pristionchus mayeri TaxID=1317129 RepID=A0AAN5DFI3_9BILA|nr:hypothetical protein PMAYCL1PPCAC_32231 [Pristionchus mayeri]
MIRVVQEERNEGEEPREINQYSKILDDRKHALEDLRRIEDIIRRKQQSILDSEAIRLEVDRLQEKLKVNMRSAQRADVDLMDMNDRVLYHHSSEMLRKTSNIF